MHRRDFLAGTLAASAFAVAPAVEAQTSITRSREFYQLRRYALQSGPQVAMTEKYISEALIPALAKRGGPVGAFRLDIGPGDADVLCSDPGSMSRDGGDA